MSRLFWVLLSVNAVFAALIFAALPFGPDLIYLVQAGSGLGMLILLGRKRQDEPLSPPPASHPVWRNPHV